MGTMVLNISKMSGKAVPKKFALKVGELLGVAIGEPVNVQDNVWFYCIEGVSLDAYNRQQSMLENYFSDLYTKNKISGAYWSYSDMNEHLR